jgi:hypothetical protein
MKVREWDERVRNKGVSVLRGMPLFAFSEEK